MDERRGEKKVVRDGMYYAIEMPKYLVQGPQIEAVDG
jgi:hypothetical protein